MNQEILAQTAARLVKPPKGIIAADESAPTCDARFEKLNIAKTEENRRAYRELLITAPGIEQYISGFILFDETIRQSTKDGKSFTSIMKEKGVDIGIKVDKGTIDFPDHPGEKITQGLEGLSERLKEYKTMGATFAKWRAIYNISANTPSEALMRENARTLAQYAKACQAEDIVPIIEPEVLLDGDHTIKKCYEVTARNLEIVFEEITNALIFLPGLILKTSMVLPGKDSKVEVYDDEIAKMTVKCLKEKVPQAIGGVVFLSGGQDDIKATIRLDAMHQLGDLPWALTFSFSRAIQNPVLQSWAANPGNVAAAQALLIERAKDNSLASIGKHPAVAEQSGH